MQLKILKRIFFWLLLVSFIGLSVIWILYVPYRPQHLYRLLPANTEFMSHHRYLADRWDTVLANPLMQALLDSAGLDVEELQAWSVDPEIRPWIDQLLARDFILAYSPALGPTQEPGWILAGWIGGESVRLRWLLKRGQLDGITAHGRSGGGMYWQVETDDAVREHLSVAVAEGMLYGVISMDPHAVRHLIDLYDGVTPGYTRVHGPPPSIRHDDAAPLDKGWFVGRNPDGAPTTYTYAINQLDEHALDGALSMPWSTPLPPQPETSPEQAARLFGDIPFLMLSAHPQVVAALAPHDTAPLARALIDEWVPALEREQVVLALTGGDYTGSYLNFSIPALTLAWPSADPEADVARLYAVLDRLNAAHQWGLVASLQRAGARPLYVVESTVSTPYSLLRSRERVAFSVVDDWIIVSSHLRPLQRLLDRFESPAALLEADDAGWKQGLQAQPSSLYGYWNIRGGARTLRLALYSYGLKLRIEDRQGSREMRALLDEFRIWLDRLVALQEAHVWLDHADGHVLARVRLGVLEDEENP